jgi:hypothetical protein
MSNKFNGAERIEMLGYEIVHLISVGKAEKVDTILEKMSEGELIEYLITKYTDEFFAVGPDCPYNLDDWEKILDAYSYLSFGHDVRRKMGIINEEQGLLMLLSLILEITASR